MGFLDQIAKQFRGEYAYTPELVLKEMREKGIKIRVRGLTKSFGGLTVLKDLDLDVYDGETLCMLGESASGKTVFLKSLAGIEHPDSGEIYIDEHDVMNAPPRQLYEMRLGLSMQFQQGALFESVSALENVQWPLVMHATVSPQEAEDRAAKDLVSVGLTPDMHWKLPSLLSGGMQKRVALCRAIVERKALILFDEPNAGLDPIKCAAIDNLLLRIKKQFKATLIMNTSELFTAYNLSDRIGIIYRGKIVEIGEPGSIKSSKHPYVDEFTRKSKEFLPQILAYQEELASWEGEKVDDGRRDSEHLGKTTGGF
ncbi:MAG: ATP-binding cassette domain-containing protein [Deltaproteobacteria bacterium]|nr:ATP-binding cassette domain-containing protein [Deltaproteobacteria bacterium]